VVSAAVVLVVALAAAVAISVVEELLVTGNRIRIPRAWKHLWFDERSAKRIFDRDGVDRIELAVQAGEKRHRGEVCIAIENRLDIYRIWAGITPAQRANKVFAQLGVWDTEENNGALLYFCLADHRLELRVDRGLARVCSQAELQDVIDCATAYFRKTEYVEGTLAAIAALHALIGHHFPWREGDANELRNRPYFL
jgi:uncharacterized membrane protein